MKKGVLTVLTFFFGLMTIYGIYDASRDLITGNGWYGLIFIAVLFAICLWRLIRPAKKQGSKSAQTVEPAQTRDAPQKPATSVPQPSAPRKKYRTVYMGKVVGVTFQGRQRTLARLKKWDDEGESLLFSLEQDEYNGEPSIKVMAEPMSVDSPPRQIGFIAKEDVPEVLPYVDTCSVLCEIYGGPDYQGEEDAKNYGCSIEVFIQE